MTILLITGTRHATIADHAHVIQPAILGALGASEDLLPHEIYVGDAAGVDLIARQFAQQRGFGLHEFEANWDECAAECTQGHRRKYTTGRGTYCPRAGVRRNRAMVRAFVAAGGTTVLAFPAMDARSSGTRGCIGEARRAGLEVPPERIIPLIVQATNQVAGHA